MNAPVQLQQEIKASPELIKLLGKKLYSNPVFSILARELLQNARDSAARKPKPPWQPSMPSQVT